MSHESLHFPCQGIDRPNHMLILCDNQSCYEFKNSHAMFCQVVRVPHLRSTASWSYIGFFFFFYFYWFSVNFTSYTPVLLISLSPWSWLPPLQPSLWPWKKKSHLGSCSVSHSTPFVSTSLLANLHYSESLVWFEASGSATVSIPDPTLCPWDPSASDMQGLP